MDAQRRARRHPEVLHVRNVDGVLQGLFGARIVSACLPRHASTGLPRLGPAALSVDVGAADTQHLIASFSQISGDLRLGVANLGGWG